MAGKAAWRPLEVTDSGSPSWEAVRERRSGVTRLRSESSRELAMGDSFFVFFSGFGSP
jgi:hypothetical protein